MIYAENPELKYHRNLVYTKVISQIANDRDCNKKISARYSEEFKRPRFMFFSGDDTGRHLSATGLAELESGLASDINKLVIDDIELKHEHKTKGQVEKYSKTLEMYSLTSLDFCGLQYYVSTTGILITGGNIIPRHVALFQAYFNQLNLILIEKAS